MKLILLLLVYCGYALLVNYFLKKKFNIGFWQAWGESDSKLKGVEIVMPVAVLIATLFLTAVTYFITVLIVEL